MANGGLASIFHRQFWSKWLRVSKAQQSGYALIGIRQIYILPTRWGLLYAVMLITMLIGSINYNLSMGFVLTFLLASLGHLAMLHTWRNLVHCKVEVLRAEPVFAEQISIYKITISDTKQRSRYALVAQLDEQYPHVQDITSSASVAGGQMFELQLPTKQRGWQTMPRITLYTEFPLSLFHAWAYVQLDYRCLIYPKTSELNQLKPLSPDSGAEGETPHTQGDEEFAGHKSYQVGDSPKRVDWKASSRGMGMLTKQYHGQGSSSIWLDWAELEYLNLQLDYEQKISLLTRWVVDAYASNLQYGLRLPKQTIQPSNTDAHYHQCLSALALME